MVASVFPMTMTGVTVRRRGVRLLGPVDLTLKAGGVTAIIGPNGAGKTTLLRVMHGVERVSAGRITWALPDAAAQARQSYVFQTPIMLRRSVAENLAYPLRLVGVGRQTRETAVQDWAARIGMTDRLGLQATRLSGGERQKLALARALIRRPEVLFLDEPCANLDGTATRAIEGLVMEAKSAGTTVFLVTHDLGQVRRLADRVLFLKAGAVVESGTTVQIMSDPQDADLNGFLQGDILT